jgi:uncharacterized RDD family membrane protein YckC
MEATGQNMQLDLGHWLLRLIAVIIDGVVIAIVAWILWAFLFVAILFTGSLAFLAIGFAYYFAYLFGWGVIWVVYAVVLESAWNATLGKRILGLKVQTVSGGKADIGKLFIRNISKIIPPLVVLDWLIGIATPGDRRQKYSDRLAGTVVVQVSQAFASITPPPSPSPPSQ